MVSARPSPSPLKGRISYPIASNYTPGDAGVVPVQDADLGHANTPRLPTSPAKEKDEDKVLGLRTWWKGFKERDREAIAEGEAETRQYVGKHVFGVPLAQSIEYASVQVSTVGQDGALYVWGVIPVVVAKCGLYLKENATEVEGAFRISGSAKRMRELQTLFDTGPKFGKNIVWNDLSYTPHDVATIFRRFLTQAPESIIPTDFYEDFRSVIAEETPLTTAITRYKALIRALPPINQYLLLYVLDLLSVFARKSDINLMTAPNLALIFQPGVLTHPVHQMRPREHVLSQQVLEFLIEHQDHFLVGMQLQPRKKSKRKPKAPKPAPPPLPPKADPDLMPASDSDDDAPEDGYYVIEGEPRAPRTADAPPIIEAVSLAPPPGRGRSSSTGARPKSPVVSLSPQTSPQAIPEEFEPSDSDEDAPAGGYVVHVSEAARAREAKAASGRRMSNSQSGVLGNFGLGRRQTLPSKR